MGIFSAHLTQGVPMHTSEKTSSTAGFTLLEMLITVALISIIAAIAIPSYMQYTKKARYSELVRATAPFKLGVVNCFHVTNDMGQCNSSSSANNGIPATLIMPASDNKTAIKSINVSKGVITAEPNAIGGLDGSENYILTPNTSTSGIIVWSASGKGVTSGLAK